MTPLNSLGRAQLLIGQSRYDLAAQELHQQIASDPDNSVAHAYLALCLWKLKRYPDAKQTVSRAIHLAPDNPFAYYVRALIVASERDYREAEAAIATAIRLDPEDADYFALLSQVRANRSNWRGAFDAANSGLALDSEHVPCANLRAHALVKLKQPDQAASVLSENLARDPENAYTHATLGWSLLHQGRPQQAIEHFREALRLDPEMEWAREGIVEALKARNPVYRVLLGYFFWMSRFSGGQRWAVILGLWAVAQAARGAADFSPALRPFLFPAICAYTIFVYLTWTSQPLFNLLLRLDRFGRVALTRRQVVASNWFGLVLSGALGFLAAWLATGQSRYLCVGGGLLFVSIPVAVFFRTLRTDFSMGYAIIAGIIGLLLICQGLGLGNLF